MKPYITLTFPTGHVYSVPTSVIAENRDKTAGCIDSAELFAEDESAIGDWLHGNMNWSDVAAHARLVAVHTNKVDEASFMQSHVTTHDEAPALEELDGDTLLDKPIELLLTAMSHRGELATMLPISIGEDFKIAFFTVRGPTHIVEGYEQMLASYTEAVVDRLQARAAQQPAEAAEAQTGA